MVPASYIVFFFHVTVITPSCTACWDMLSDGNFCRQFLETAEAAVQCFNALAEPRPKLV